MTHRLLRPRLVLLAVVAALALVALGLGSTAASAASKSCGVVTAGGHPYIVVAKSVTCATAARVVKGFGTRLNAVASGRKVVVRSPLAGFTCILTNLGHRGGGCSTVGAVRSIIWLSA